MARAGSNTDAYLCDCWGNKKKKEKQRYSGTRRMITLALGSTVTYDRIAS
jgi:hypothetical protein